jgi:hypothetical protein
LWWTNRPIPPAGGTPRTISRTWHGGAYAAPACSTPWAYDLESSFFIEPVQRADAAYNLACFYARVGRMEEALRLLRESLAANRPSSRWPARITTWIGSATGPS